jgi:formylmethanofuran dehydrogenase subunit E
MQGKEARCNECGEMFVAPVRFDLAETLGRASRGLLKDIY